MEPAISLPVDDETSDVLAQAPPYDRDPNTTTLVRLSGNGGKVVWESQPFPGKDINLDKLISALEIMMLNQDVFRHVGIEAGVESEGYEGKLRTEYLKLYANRVINNGHFSFFV